MSQLLRRFQMDFGKTDAKSAMVTRDASAKRLFLDAFAAPSPSDVEAIRSGDRFLFYGTKGSGKTALLRYMMELEKGEGNVTRAIVFSEDITEQEKGAITRDADFDDETKPDIGETRDTRDMWRVYLVRKITDLLVSNNAAFDDISDAKRLNAIVTKLFDDNKLSGLAKILAGLKSGSLKLKGKASDFAEIEAVLNWENPGEGHKINYNRFAELAVKKICSFSYPNDVKYILYLDELNLSMIGQKQHKKDSILIRDLIITVGNLNRIFTEHAIPIYIYAAVRVEIAKAVSISRHEIDKYLVDHGHHLQWHGAYDVSQYPIFEIVENRITALETKFHGKCSERNKVWENYFSRDVFGVGPKKFISEITWCNPRDIVNLFNLAAKAEAGRPLYDTNVFASVLNDYSEIAWTERAEELNAEHNMNVVSGMRRFLSGWKRNFTMSEFVEHAKRLSERDALLMQVLKTVGADKICRDLYHVGVLGQSVMVGSYQMPDNTVRFRFHQTWFYRDNREFDPAQHLNVHKALYSCLKLGGLRVTDFGNDPRYQGG